MTRFKKKKEINDLHLVGNEHVTWPYCLGLELDMRRVAVHCNELVERKEKGRVGEEKNGIFPREVVCVFDKLDVLGCFVLKSLSHF